MEGPPVSDETCAADRPATFRDVFASRAYRYVFGANTLSWVGDHLAKAAVTALVYDRTRSVALSAIAFGLSYLPWLTGGPVLAAIAERHRYRTVMIICDILRAVLMALVAIPGVPVGVMLLLLFATGLANPPFQAARSALLPQILTGDRYVVGLSLQTSTGQAAQITGYVIGAGLAPFWPRVALLINAATFLMSALLIRIGVGEQGPIAQVRAAERHLGRETLDGFRIVFGTRVLRAIAVVVFSAMLFAVVPEGLAAAWAVDLSASRADRGWIQGVIMMSEPVGFIVGGLVIGRLVRPELRRRLIQPFAVLGPLALVPAFVQPSVAVLALMCVICGFSVAGMMPAANGLFVQALPAGYRARAFGVMQGGVQVMQGVAVLATGVLADRYDIPSVVGGWSLAGVLLLAIIWLRWPSPGAVADAITAASAQPVPAPPHLRPGRRPGPVEAPGISAESTAPV
jgi:MFS family permease